MLFHQDVKGSELARLLDAEKALKTNWSLCNVQRLDFGGTGTEDDIRYSILVWSPYHSLPKTGFKSIPNRNLSRRFEKYIDLYGYDVEHFPKTYKRFIAEEKKRA